MSDTSPQPAAQPPEQAAPPDRLEQDHGDAFGMEDAETLGVATAVKDAVHEFKSLDYAHLLPTRRILDSQLLKKKAVRWVLTFGLLPLVFYQITLKFQLTFVDVVWLIEIYFCLFWALYFYSIIQPSKTIWRRAIGYACFTALIGIPLLLAAQKLPIVRGLYARTESYSLVGRLIGYILGVGVFEETCKALPLIIFGLRKGTIDNAKEGVFLGLMSGFGFAAAEGVQYTVGATVDAINYGGAAATGQVLTLLDRVMSGPIQHGAWAGVTGWFIGVAANRKGPKWPVVTVGIAFMAILHGLFDTFSEGPSGLVIAAFSLIVFMAYLSHGDAQNPGPLVETKPVA